MKIQHRERDYLPMSWHDRPLMESSCVAELRSLQTATTQRYWNGFWPRLAVGFAVCAAIAGLLVMIFG